MLKYFDKTFFKFLVGFVSVLAISFSIMIITNYLAKYYYQDLSANSASVFNDMYSSIEFSADDVATVQNASLGR